MFLNPPYGLRLSHGSQHEDTRIFYHRLGQRVKGFRSLFEHVEGFVLLASDDAFHGLYTAFGKENIGAVKSFNQGGRHVRAVSFSF